MEDKIKKSITQAKRNVKVLKHKTVQAIDQNDDGKFDLSDVASIADSIGNSAQKGMRTIQETAEEKARKLELKLLQPIFPETLDSGDFVIPKFIRITDREKKYIDSEVCQGSIGYQSTHKGLYVVNIFSDSIDAFGLEFHPNQESEFYYIDPSDRDRYIALDDYFSYLKIARINELQKIAQDLGAKHFKVTYKEEQTSFTENKVKTKAQVKSAATTEANHQATEKRYSAVEIAAEMHFPGHPPVRPQVRYWLKDSSIQSLIEMRMDETSPLLDHKLMLKMSNSSGMKETDAAKIDAALKAMKFSGNATVESEARNEARRYLEYIIEF